MCWLYSVTSHVMSSCATFSHQFFFSVTTCYADTTHAAEFPLAITIAVAGVALLLLAIVIVLVFKYRREVKKRTLLGSTSSESMQRAISQLDSDATTYAHLTRPGEDLQLSMSPQVPSLHGPSPNVSNSTWQATHSNVNNGPNGVHMTSNSAYEAVESTTSEVSASTRTLPPPGPSHSVLYSPWRPSVPRPNQSTGSGQNNDHIAPITIRVGHVYEDLDGENHVTPIAGNEDIGNQEFSRANNNTAYVNQSPDHAMPNHTATGGEAASSSGESATPIPRYESQGPGNDPSTTHGITDPLASMTTNILYPSYHPGQSVEHPASSSDGEEERGHGISPTGPGGSEAGCSTPQSQTNGNLQGSEYTASHSVGTYSNPKPNPPSARPYSSPKHGSQNAPHYSRPRTRDEGENEPQAGATRHQYCNNGQSDDSKPNPSKDVAYEQVMPGD